MLCFDQSHYRKGGITQINGLLVSLSFQLNCCYIETKKERKKKEMSCANKYVKLAFSSK